MNIKPENTQHGGTDQYAIQQPGVPTAPSPVVTVEFDEDC